MSIKDVPTICHCGKKQHLTEAQKLVLTQWGHNWDVYKKVKILNGKTYKVPTYYIMVHGITHAQLPSLGFPEWKD